MNDRGFAVPLAILVIVAMGLVGAAAAWMAAGDTNIASLYATSNHASDAAGAGIEHALAQYEDRLLAYDADTDGDLMDYLLDGDWPLEAEIDGYDYTVMVSRDSFDFDGDGDEEAVSCEDDGGSGSGSGGSGGSGGSSGGSDGGSGSSDGSDGSSGGGAGSGSGGSGGAGTEGAADTTKYWEDGSTSDKDGDGELGFAEGHFDVDVFSANNKGQVDRDYHQHQFDDKYDTKAVDIFNDPNLLWDDLVGKQAAAYDNELRMTFINQDSARGALYLKIKGTETFLDLQTATEMTFDPEDLQALRVTFESLGSLRKTNPGAVQGDDIDRDNAWTVRFYDANTGALVYENSEYWHYNNKGGSTTSSSSDGGSSSSGGTGGSTGTTTTGGGKNCKNAADHEEDALKHEAKAREHEVKAEEELAKGNAKKAADEQVKADKEWVKAAEDWALAEADCALAKAAGEDCVCGNYNNGNEEDEEATPPDTTDTAPDTTSSGGSGGSSGSSGGSTGTSCTLNGDGDGDPVFVLTSTASRGSWQATHRMRITSLAASQVLRLSWIAD